MSTKDTHLLRQFRRSSVLRTGDLERHGFSRTTLRNAVRKGVLIQVERGVYEASTSVVTEKHDYAQVALRHPESVICLLSALRFHDLTTQSPPETWIAIGRKDWCPVANNGPSLRVVRFSEADLKIGVETYEVEGGSVKVTSIARTVVDLFRLRQKVGIEVALEALRESWRNRLCTTDELTHLAQARRATNVMKPYLEFLS